MATLTVLIGPAGSGKSSYAAACWRPEKVVSSDELRGLLTGDPANQDANAEVFALLHAIVGQRLRRGADTVVDATNSHVDHRATLLEIARATRATAVAVVLDTPLAVCLARNATRPQQVPEDAIRAQYQRVQDSLPYLLSEGFTVVTELNGDANGQR
jgi:protein phosphatase